MTGARKDAGLRRSARGNYPVLVPNFSLVTRIHVLTAIRNYDQQGAAEFLDAHGFEEPGDLILVERGKRYDASALLAFAHGKATGTALTPEEIPFGADKVLTDLGFTVASLMELNRPAPTKRVPGTRAPAVPRASTPRVAKPKTPAKPEKPEPVVVLCPKCFTQVPSTGRCDYCD